MSATVAVRHQARPVASTRQWTAGRLAEASRLQTPSVRHLVRQAGDPDPGTPLVATHDEVGTWQVVTRLWLGVLSIFALIVAGGLVLIILGAWAFGYRPVVVTSGSMEPAVRTGDVVITKPIGMRDDVGDQTVIDFEDPATADRHLHRVIEVTPEGYRTKGDANADADPQLVPQDHVHGAGFVLAPYVGYVPIWIDQRAWTPLAICAVALIALSTMSRKAWMWAGERR